MLLSSGPLRSPAFTLLVLTTKPEIKRHNQLSENRKCTDISTIFSIKYTLHCKLSHTRKKPNSYCAFQKKKELRNFNLQYGILDVNVFSNAR